MGIDWTVHADRFDTAQGARDPSDRQRESRTLDEGVLSIGRGPSNNWVLQDPAQHLSKVHCVVTSTRGGYVLTDCSSNGVFLNGSKKRMERDAKVPIADGDEFVLGDYLVQVSEVANLTSRTVTAQRRVPCRVGRPRPWIRTIRSAWTSSCRPARRPHHRRHPHRRGRRPGSTRSPTPRRWRGTTRSATRSTIRLPRLRRLRGRPFGEPEAKVTSTGPARPVRPARREAPGCVRRRR